MIDAIDQIIIDIKTGSINEAKEKILKLEQDAYKRGYSEAYKQGYIDGGIFCLTERQK